MLNGDLRMAKALGYEPVRELPTREVAGVLRMLCTYGLFVGIGRYGYRTRYCYARKVDAVAALMAWDGRGDPPGPWIKKRGEVERLGPGALISEDAEAR